MSPTLNLGSGTVVVNWQSGTSRSLSYVIQLYLRACYRVILSGLHGIFSLTLIGPLLVDRPPKSRASKCKERCWDWSPKLLSALSRINKISKVKVKCHQLWFNYTFTLAFLPKYQLTPSTSDCQ